MRFLLLAAILAAVVLACTPEADTPYTPRQIAEVILASQEDAPPLQLLETGDGDFGVYLPAIYQLEAGDVTEGAIYYADGVAAEEIAVFLLAPEAEPGDWETALSAYIEQRTDAFTGYAPMQAAILENSKAVLHGDYAALLICQDPDEAEAAFLACFGENPPELPEGAGDAAAPPGDAAAPAGDAVAETPGSEGTGKNPPEAELPAIAGPPEGENSPENTEPPEGGNQAEGTEPREGEGAGTEGGAGGPGVTDTQPVDTDGASGPPEDAGTSTGESTGESAGASAGGYDRAAILAAWESGDAGALSEKNKSILEACSAAIGELITGEMNGYEKELAVHDWIIDLASYDRETLSNSPDADPSPDNDNPYGLLFHRKAVCLGYTLTFQLFMDMLDIECITVEGASGAEEHAWNMVRFQGEWYCVDVTWDDPGGIMQTAAVTHRYFNVSSEFLRNNNHQWEESGVPEAVSPKLYTP